MQIRFTVTHHQKMAKMKIGLFLLVFENVCGYEEKRRQCVLLRSGSQRGAA